MARRRMRPGPAVAPRAERLHDLRGRTLRDRLSLDQGARHPASCNPWGERLLKVPAPPFLGVFWRLGGSSSPFDATTLPAATRSLSPASFTTEAMVVCVRGGLDPQDRCHQAGCGASGQTAFRIALDMRMLPTIHARWGVPGAFSAGSGVRRCRFW